MSFATLLKVGKELNNKKELDIIQLALLYSELPNKYKKKYRRRRRLFKFFVNVVLWFARVTCKTLFHLRNEGYPTHDECV